MTKKLLLVGQETWCRHLEMVMSRYGDWHAEYCASVAMRSSARPDLVVRVGYRPGAMTVRGAGYDALWELAWRRWGRPRSIVYWIGTDVENALRERDRFPSVALRRPSRYHHFAGAPWLTDELLAAGIDAETVLFPDLLDASKAPPMMPGRHAILTYLPAGREGDYGAEAIMYAARAFPTVPFRVIGSQGPIGNPWPPNVEAIGRVPSIDGEMARATIVLRVVRHDALGGTVREALVAGRHVAYTYRVDGCDFVKFGDSDGLVAILASLLGRSPHLHNAQGRAFARQRFGQRSRDDFVRALRSVA